MPTAGLAPLDESITIAELTRDPYPIYRRLRREAPVLRVKSVGRTFLTKAADTRLVKDNATLFSSNDPNTPMERAFLARTLMRKDHDEHRSERMAMMPALMPKTIESTWATLYAELAADYLDRLPRGEIVDLVPALAGPLAARILAHAMGVPDASDDDMPEIPAELMQQMLGEQLKAHYATWPDIALPALAGKTPRQALESASGRAQVEALLKDMEHTSHGTPLASAYDFDDLRRALGLVVARGPLG